MVLCPDHRYKPNKCACVKQWISLEIESICYSAVGTLRVHYKRRTHRVKDVAINGPDMERVTQMPNCSVVHLWVRI